MTKKNYLQIVCSDLPAARAARNMGLPVSQALSAQGLSSGAAAVIHARWVELIYQLFDYAADETTWDHMLWLSLRERAGDLERQLLWVESCSDEEDGDISELATESLWAVANSTMTSDPHTFGKMAKNYGPSFLRYVLAWEDVFAETIDKNVFKTRRSETPVIERLSVFMTRVYAVCFFNLLNEDRDLKDWVVCLKHVHGNRNMATHEGRTLSKAMSSTFGCLPDEFPLAPGTGSELFENYMPEPKPEPSEDAERVVDAERGTLN